MSKKSLWQGDPLRDDLESRQRNTVWPDTLRNASSVDGYLWHGNPNAPLVQRVGAVVLGLAYLVCSGMIFYIGTHFWPFYVPAALFAYVAFRMIRNAFLKPE